MREIEEIETQYHADNMAKLPPEEAAQEVFDEWLLKFITGFFDLRAAIYTLAVDSYETADELLAHLDSHVEYVREFPAVKGHSSPGFASELKVRLNQRRLHWRARILKQAREVENQHPGGDRPEGEAQATAEGTPNEIKQDTQDIGTGVEMQIPEWLRTEPERIVRSARPKGSLETPSQTDPIWSIAVKQKGPIPITRLSGEVEWIDPACPDESVDASFKPDDDRHIAEVTLNGRAELRAEIERVFSGADWPPVSMIIEPLRRYATKVFDANAAAYQNAVSAEARNPQEVLDTMARNLLSDVFGCEWESSPGERVTRTDWQASAEGWKGREIVVLAGNDPDKNCLYHQVVGDAVMHRYRFHAVIPAPKPGEPPGINSKNLEWWKYIGLNERHNLAMAIKPYLEDRVTHWHFIYGSTSPCHSAGASEATGDVPADGNSAINGQATLTTAEPPPRKRGRPSEIDDATKEAALAAKARGAQGKEIAQIIYRTPYPNAQKVKNAANILKHYQKSRSRSPNKS